MKLIIALVIGCYLLLFEDSVRSDKYNLDIVKGITEVPMSTEFLDPKWYQSAYDDYFRHEKDRIEMCQKGLLHLKDHKTQVGRTFPDEEVYKAEKLKLYVLAGVKDQNTGKTDFKLLMASKCLTSPPIYIYITNLNVDNGNELEFRVILKDSGPPLSFNNINNYHMKLVDYITEATADDIKTILSKGTVQHTLHDMDELEEKERFRMCQGGMRTVPEMKIELHANALAGTSKYYIVGHKIDRREENPADTQFLIQAFDCPTKPKLYVSIRDGEEAGPILWTMVKLSETEFQPKFNVMGYSVVLLKSIKIYEKPQNENKEKSIEALNESLADLSVDHFANEDENKQKKLDESVHGESIDLIVSDDENENKQTHSKLRRMTSRELIRGLSDLKIQRGTSNELIANDDYTEIDTNQLTKEERHYICANAIRVVFEHDVEFIEDNSELSQYYTVEEEQTGEITERLKAYECPTKDPAPKIYLNIIDRESIENMVVILFEGKKNFNRLLAEAQPF